MACAHGPILHYRESLIDKVGTFRACLDHLVERLIAKEPIATGRTETPNIQRSVGQEMVLWALQTLVLTNAVEDRAVLDLQIVDALDI